MKPKTKTQQALSDLGACSPAVRWVNGKSPAVAWRECTRPDWLVWLVGQLAEENKYYRRAAASVLSVCIDVLVDAGMVYQGDNPYGCGSSLLGIRWIAVKEEDSQEAIQYVNKISTLLDSKGQGKRVSCLAIDWGSIDWGYLALLEAYQSPLCYIVKAGQDYLKYDDCSTIYNDLSEQIRLGSDVTPKHRRELCREIRRVCERPSIAEIEEVVRRFANVNKKLENLDHVIRSR